MDSTELGRLLLILLFPVKICGGFWLSIFVHELGHAVCGKLAGLRIFACGIGSQHPFLRLRVGETNFYVGWPLTSGMTLGLHETVAVPWTRMVIFTVGGPLASLVFSALMTAVAVYGDANAFVVTCAAASGIFFISSVISAQGKVGGVASPNDAILVRSFWNRCHAELSNPGTHLALFTALRDSCSDLNSIQGMVHMTLAVAANFDSLGDDEGVREALSHPALDDPKRGDTGIALEAYLRAALALHTGSLETERVLRAAENVLEGDHYALAGLHLAAANAAIDRGLAPDGLLDNAADHARAADVPALERTVEAVRLTVAPGEDFAEACRRLLRGTGPQQLDPVVALSLACMATQILVSRNRLDEARPMFQESVRRLNQIAATIPLEATRQKFKARFAAPLAAAVGMVNDGVPLFIP
jgi:hypothetical protein